MCTSLSCWGHRPGLQRRLHQVARPLPHRGAACRPEVSRVLRPAQWAQARSGELKQGVPAVGGGGSLGKQMRSRRRRRRRREAAGPGRHGRPSAGRGSSQGGSGPGSPAGRRTSGSCRLSDVVLGPGGFAPCPGCRVPKGV